MRYLPVLLLLAGCGEAVTAPEPDFFILTTTPPQFWWVCEGFDCSFQTKDKTVPALWDLGDGSSGDMQEVWHTYAAAGTYTTVLTQDGQSAGVSFPLPNAAPVPSYTVSCNRKHECTFTSTSTDDYGLVEQVFHFYDCFDWGCQTAAQPGLSPVTRKFKPGTHRARLDVRDSHGVERMVQADFTA